MAKEVVVHSTDVEESKADVEVVEGKVEEETIEHARVISKQEVTESFLHSLYEKLGVTPKGAITTPDEGRIATNIIQDTTKGKLMVRIYPTSMPDKLETGDPQFEVIALRFLADRGFPVPKPLQFAGGASSYEDHDHFVFAYYLLEGESIAQDALNPTIALSIGKFLREFVEHSCHFTPAASAIDSFDYIVEIAQKLEEKVPGLSEWKVWNRMKDEVKGYKGSLADTASGIVHADFFFENILQDHEGRMSLLDFGDAYFGKLLHDVVIASMEASVTESDGVELWNFDSFKNALVPLSTFLVDNHISFEQFFNTLKANCMRFAVYTIPFDIAEERDFHTNNYVERYNKISTDYQDNLHAIYDEVMGATSAADDVST